MVKADMAVSPAQKQAGDRIEKNILHDKDIREPLFDYLDERYGKNRILEEKRMGRSRADLVMVVEGELIGLEIKSDADSYERLKRQARDYNKFCDRNYIVIGKSHQKHVEEHIAKNWGILCAAEEKGTIQITQIRAAEPNPKCRLEYQIKWLWRPELNHILERNRLPAYKQKSKAFVQERLIARLDSETLKFQMCEELFERDYTLWEAYMEEYRGGNSR